VGAAEHELVGGEHADGHHPAAGRAHPAGSTLATNG
ncbi:MAG: hypothetical protein JWP76_2729, partial [Dactylosporangium sp.]|nr:hypothetical protein [Dactylosporangium sp.]